MKINRKHAYFLTSGVLFFLLFFAFTFLVRQDLLRTWDFNMTVRLQDKTPIRFDEFFSLLSVVGRFEYTVGALIIFLIIRRKILGVLVFGLFGLAHIVELIGKTILSQPGPPNMFLRSHYSEFPGLYVHTDASYPSGHSRRAVFLGILFSYTIYASKRIPQVVKLGAILSIWGLIGAILYSRVSLGEHWSTDVIGGTLLGISMGSVSILLLEFKRKKLNAKR